MKHRILLIVMLIACLAGGALAEAIDETPAQAPAAAVAVEDKEAIRQAQQGLIDLGLLSGKADGIAGKKTAAAVLAFQEMNGLPETGVLDAVTCEAIRAAKPASVKDVQQRLIDLGYLQGAADGKWGGKSTSAMRLFQQLHDLNVTGTADAISVTRLFQDDAMAMPAPLRSGASGEEVTKLQEKLTQFGFMTDPVDGSYGRGTVAAVKEFQQRLMDQGLAEAFEITATGEATGMTQLILFNNGYTTYLHDVAAGDTADEALRIERRLHQLGYMDMDAHNTLDDYAVQALELFKERAGVLTFGAADRATIDALFSEDAPEAVRPAWRDIASGDTGLTVSAAERALVDGGMLVKLTDGAYDREMEKGVERLYNYLKEQKSPDAELFANEKALSGQAVAALCGGLLDYVADVGGSGKNVDAETARVQRRLHVLYYLPKEGVDGKAGSQSRDAIKLFQTTNGLEATGVADRATQEVLFSDEALEKRFPYRIHVRLDTQRVEVYELTEQNSYELTQSFICSTGLHDATPHGVFFDGHPINRWHHFEKFNCWAQYAYEIQGDILFHSVIYRAKEGKATQSSINNLGRPASHGCVRLRVEDAKWIYENCKRGKTVILVS